MHRLVSFVTDFGDTAVTVPLALMILLVLAAMRRPGLALRWAVAVVLCAGVIGGLKIVLAGCSNRIALPGLVSPSGHCAMSTIVYGGLALLLGSSLPGWQRRLVYAAAALLVAAVAVSRLILRVHTPEEVAVGLAVGIAALALLHASTGPVKLSRPPVLVLAAAALAVIVVAHGTRWPAERAIDDIARSRLFHVVASWCR